MPTTFFSSPDEFAITCVVLLVAQLIYVMFGFGSGLIAAGGLALVLPELQDVVVLLLVLNLPSELWVCWQSRQDIHWRPIAMLGVGVAFGIPVGTLLLKDGDPRFVLFLLGAFLMAVGLLFLKLPSGGNRRAPRWAAPPVGFVSGLLAGLFGTAGPPLIIWYHLTASSKSAFRGNIMTIFLLMNLVRVPSYAVSGLITPLRLWSALAVLPMALLGAWLGHRLHIRLSEEAFRRLVSGLLIILGLLLVLR
ncbi:MAG: sulfite exporter TauE/SafE family protein [Verrucomicrobia bacterium]|nr:sulfite exporter TauE/SafE family protein [Verrucomicrobiota bacterium]